MTTGPKICAECDNLGRTLAAREHELQALRATIEQLTRHDALTGVFNRRSIIEALDAELLRARRTGHPFCFAVIDLDHFRQVNDRYGNPIGDQILKSFAEIAVRLLRALDAVGRLDGEEFGILLPVTWLDQGVIALNRLTKAVAEHPWTDLAPALSLDFSAGITTNALGDTADSMIQRAEKALAQAKQEGRGRIVQIEEPLPDMPAMDMD